MDKRSKREKNFILIIEHVILLEQISLVFSNIFLIRGDKNIIVDTTGRPRNEKRILQTLKKRNISQQMFR